MAFQLQSGLDLANANLTKSLMLYLGKYLEVATGGRVECYSQITQAGYSTNSFIRFKCKTCSDNWNVGAHLFAGGGIPTELTDWVEKHQHVCKEFKPKSSGLKVCGSCEWPWDKHKEGKPYLNSKGNWIIPSYACPVRSFTSVTPKTYISPIIYAPIPAPAPASAVPASPKVVRLTEVQGRKFRE
jgi:hypothetical protein